MWETLVRSLGWKDSLEKEMAIHSSPLAWKIPWTEEPGRLYSPWDSKELHMTEHLHFLQKVPCMHCCTQCPRPCSWPLPTHISSTGDSWTLTGKSGSVPVGSLLLSPGSWCIQGFVCDLQESVSSVLCKFWRLYGGLMATSSKRTYAIPRSAASRAPVPAAVH